MDNEVSIPRSEFWSFGPGQRSAPEPQESGFNSSVGILVVRTSQVIQIPM